MVDQLAPEFGPSERAADLRAVVSPPPAKKFAVAIFSTIGVLVIIAGGLVWARAVFYSPEAAVNGYISALQNRDATAALTHLGPQRGLFGDDLLQPQVVKDPGYTPPADLQIRSVQTNGDTATVTAAMRLGSETATTTTTTLHAGTRQRAAVAAVPAVADSGRTWWNHRELAVRRRPDGRG